MYMSFWAALVLLSLVFFRVNSSFYPDKFAIHTRIQLTEILLRR